MAIRYANTLDGIEPQMLRGFFEGWQRPLSAGDHLRMIEGSSHVVLAIDDSARRVVGFINAVSDGFHSAFIPCLEVLPSYRRRGIGRELLNCILDRLGDFCCVDLTCDPELQAYYEKSSMQRSVGMVVRKVYEQPEDNEARSTNSAQPKR